MAVPRRHARHRRTASWTGTGAGDPAGSIDDAVLAVDIFLDGHVPERVGNVRVSPLEGDSLERVRLVPLEAMGRGSLAGRLVDAEGEPLAGATAADTGTDSVRALPAALRVQRLPQRLG